MRALLVLGSLLLAGCASPIDLPAAEGGSEGASGKPFAFLPPVLVNGEEHAYEPSIEARDDGALFITAAPLLRDRGAQLASWLWRSVDEGATWEPMPSPVDAQRRLPALEGEIALDATGRLYFVDTSGPDMTFSRWSAEGEWETSMPLPTPLMDDRPWLEAAGDGQLYLLLNNVVEAPDLLGGAAARIWLYVSRDAGETWLPARSFPSAHWCTGAARDERVVVACSRPEGAYVSLYSGLVTGTSVVLYDSTDAGATWSEAAVWPTTFRFDADHSPSVALDVEGRALVGWLDDDRRRLVAARETAAGWVVEDAAPAGLGYGEMWACAGGAMALAYYTTDDPTPGGGSEWRVHAALFDGVWRNALLDEEPVAVGSEAPGDFLQCDVDAEGRVHVAYHREGPGEPGLGRPGDVFYARSSESFAVRSA